MVEHGKCICKLGYDGSIYQSCLFISPYKHRLPLIVLILDIGCKAGESLSCLNNGTCLDSGLRECPFGYNGVKCEKCN